MDFFEQNMKSIKENRPFLYNQMQITEPSTYTNPVEHICSVDTKEGVKSVQLTVDSKIYNLNSLYYPRKEAQKWVVQHNSNNLNTVISVYGLGNGHFVRELIKKFNDKGTILIYEPSADIFFHVLHNYDLKDIIESGRISISVENINTFEFHNLLRSVLNITNLRDQIQCVLPQYDKIFPSSCIKFWKELKEGYLYVRKNINTEIVFGQRFIDNILCNLKHVKNSSSIIDLKYRIPQNMPAVVVAAGPSVGKNIDELKRLKGKSVIFAVDRILDFLLDSDLEPDFVVSLDPMKPIEYFSRRDDVTIPLICFLETNYEVLDLHKGKKIICNCTPILEEFYVNHGKIPPGMNSSASVATATFGACVELGFQKIILVGQDLAYDGNVTHAGGIKEQTTNTYDDVVEDIHGNMVKSRSDWKSFISWYEDYIIMNPHLEVIDAKTKGAKIKGTTVMPLKDIINTILEIDTKELRHLNELAPTFGCNEGKELKQYLENNESTLKEMKKKAEKAIEICDTLIRLTKKGYADNKLKPELDKLTKINKYIMEQPIYSLMDKYVISVSAQQLSEIHNITDDTTNDSINIFTKTKTIFDAIIGSIDYIRNGMAEALKSMEEEADSDQII